MKHSLDFRANLFHLDARLLENCNLPEGDLSQQSGFAQLPIVQISTGGDRLNLKIGFAPVWNIWTNILFPSSPWPSSTLLWMCVKCKLTRPKKNELPTTYLRHWLQYWQLRTWINDNLCYLTINCDTGQNSQFLQCFACFLPVLCFHTARDLCFCPSKHGLKAAIVNHTYYAYPACALPLPVKMSEFDLLILRGIF